MRNIIRTAGLLVSLSLGIPHAASAQVLTYGGNPDPQLPGALTLINNSENFDAIAYDDFQVAAGSAWTVSGVFGNFVSTSVPSVLNWEIRQGMVVGSTLGTVVQSGAGAFTTAGETFTIGTPFFNLTEGTYWLGIFADYSGLEGGLFAVRATSGSDAVNALSNSSAIFGIAAERSLNLDLSLGVLGTSTSVSVPVPEPATATLLAFGLAGLVISRRRHA